MFGLNLNGGIISPGWYDSSSPVFWSSNLGLNPEWHHTQWSNQDWFQTQHLLPRDGYQLRSFSPQIFNARYEQVEDGYSGLIGYVLLDHYQSIPNINMGALFPPQLTINTLSGKGLQDWVKSSDKQILAQNYYSPVMPVAGDIRYLFLNTRTNLTEEYFRQVSLTNSKFRFLNKYSVYLLERQQQIFMNYFNTWNVTAYKEYAINDPRTVYGQHPVKLLNRASLVYQPFIKNYLHTSIDSFRRHSLFHLGQEPWFNFTRSINRFNQHSYSNQLPLWESYLNGLFIRSQAEVYQPEITLPPNYDYLGYFQAAYAYNRMVFYTFYSFLVWGLRIFLIFGSTYYFLVVFKKRYLSFLVFKSLSLVQIQPRHRTKLNTSLFANQQQLIKPVVQLKSGQLNSRRKQQQLSTLDNHLYTHQIRLSPDLFGRPRRYRRLFKYYRRSLVHPRYLRRPYNYPLSPINFQQMLFRHPTLIKQKTNFALFRWINFNRSQRRLKFPYRVNYQARPRSNLFQRVVTVVPQDEISHRNSLYRVNQSFRSSVYRLNFDRHHPTSFRRPLKINRAELKLNSRLALPKGYTSYGSRFYPRRQFQPSSLSSAIDKYSTSEVKIRTSFLTSYNLGQTHFNLFKKSRLTHHEGKNLLNLKKTLTSSNWLITPKKIVFPVESHHLTRQPLESELYRRSNRRQRRLQTFRDFRLYYDDPMLLLNDYDHYRESTKEWYFSRGYRKRATPNQDSAPYNCSPGDTDQNLTYRKNLTFKHYLLQQQQANQALSQPVTVVPPRWLSITMQHRYQLQIYHQTLSLHCQTSLPLLESTAVVEAYYQQLSQVRFPGQQNLTTDYYFEQELTNDFDHTEFHDEIQGHDNGDEDESEFTVEEHDDLFDHSDQYNMVSTNLQPLVNFQLLTKLDLLHLNEEDQARQLLTSYKRWRSLPIECYQLNVVGELFTTSNDQRLSEIYWGPFSVDHQAYSQLMLTTYAVPKMYRRLTRKIKQGSLLKIHPKVKPGHFELKIDRQYGFRWTKSRRGKFQSWSNFYQSSLSSLHHRRLNQRRSHYLTSNNHHQSLLAADGIKPHQDRPQQTLTNDYPVCHPWLTINRQPVSDSIWSSNYGQLSQDYFYQAYSAMVDYPETDLGWVLQDEQSLSFFDYSLSYNLGYRYTGDYLYSLLNFRPYEAEETCFTQPYTYEEGINIHRELVSEDLNYVSFKDYESCYLEFFCQSYFEGYSLLYFFLEDNTDFLTKGDTPLEDQDEIEEYDELSETPTNDSHLPSYLSSYALITAIGQSQVENQSDRLSLQASTAYELYPRQPRFNWKKGYHLTRYYWPHELATYQYQAEQKVQTDLGYVRLRTQQLFSNQVYAQQALAHDLMQTPVDQTNQILSDEDFHQHLLKVWALTDCYYSDVSQGYSTNY